MTSDPESRLFDFAGSNRNPETEDEHMVTELHAALGFDNVPLRLRKPPVAQPTRSWRHYFPAAAAVVLVIALLGASFSTLLPDRDDGDHFASVPPVVLGVASPDKMSANETCSFEHHPLILQANEFPIDDLTVIYTDSGELKLHCPASGEDQTLANDVVTVEPTGAPETLLIGVRAPDRPEYEPANLALLNLRSGSMIELEKPRTDQTFTQSPFSPWYVSSLSADTNDLQVTDLRNMESYVLETPSWVEDTSNPSGHVTSSEDGSVSAIVRSTSLGYSSDRGQLIGENESTPQLLIIRDDFETAEWIDIADIEDPITTATMSPDGKFIALGLDRNTSDDYLGGVNQYIVVETASGDEIGRTESDGLFRVSSAQWSLDSDNFIYTIGDELGVINSVAGDGNRVLLQDDGAVNNLMLTPDPNIVLVDISSVQSDSVLALYRVDITAGEAELIGQSGPREFFNAPTMRTPIIGLYSESEATLIDSATGQVLDSWAYERVGATPTISEEMAIASPLQSLPFSIHELDGGISLWIWNYDLEPKHIVVPSLPSDISRYQLRLADGGQYIYIQELQEPIDFDNPMITYILDTASNDPEWIPVE